MNKKIYDIMNMSIQMAFIGFLFFNFDFGFGGNGHIECFGLVSVKILIELY